MSNNKRISPDQATSATGEVIQVADGSGETHSAATRMLTDLSIAKNEHHAGYILISIATIAFLAALFVFISSRQPAGENFPQPSTQPESAVTSGDADTGVATTTSLIPPAVEVVWQVYNDGKIAFMYPPSWQVQVSASVEEPSILVQSPTQSNVVILPKGGFAYGIDPDSVVVSGPLNIAGFTAIRVDFLDPDTSELRLTRVVFDPPLSTALEFRIDFRPNGEPSSEALFDQILSTLLYDTVESF
jgi:hypothetical protein